MSSATKSSTCSPPAEAIQRTRVADVGRLLSLTVRAVAFWAAVLLPMAILLAVMSGMATENPIGVAGLIGINAACAVLGHEHSP